MRPKELKAMLDSIAPTYYMAYQPEDLEDEKTPIIVFGKVNSTFREYADDRSSIRTTLYQVNLVSKDAKEADVLSRKLEETLTAHELTFSLTSEYQNQNNMISTVYEIRTEEIINA